MTGRRLSLSSVTLLDPFWLAWQDALMQRGLLHQWEQCEETGRLENFRRAARGERSGHEGYVYNDSDVYKWLEAACYALARDPAWEGRAKVDEAVKTIASAQMEDGYIDTAFQLGRLEDRWKALSSKHEMYCMGHLIEAAVAHHRATGRSSFLKVARKAADHVCDRFGPAKTKGYCGHEEVELALAALAEETGQAGYRETARWMVMSRGSRPSPFESEFADPVGKELNQNYLPLVFPRGDYEGAYFQDDMPLAQQSEAVGHAVRAMYLYCGAVEACDDDAIGLALKRIFHNLVRRRIYVTGGIGSAGRNEGFTRDFDLPNREAYAETCAAIGLVFWASRMSRLTGDSFYADWMELALYNAALSGVNLETDRYFYVNPLESRGDHHRQPWFGCACCPPNIARLLLSVQAYGAYASADGLTIDLPFAATYRVHERGSFRVESHWPYRGTVVVRFEGDASEGAVLRLRVPSWALGFEATWKGGRQESVAQGYLEVGPGWADGDELRVDFASLPEWVACDPAVPDNVGRLALRFGPLVYCLEQADYGRSVHSFRPNLIEPGFEFERGRDPRQPRGLHVNGWEAEAPAPQTLYGRPLVLNLHSSRTTFVPYFSWDNRAPGTMAVWHASA